MSKRIAILHYASPPVVGGVEATIAYHARGLVELGYQVNVVSGSGSTFDERIETHINPLFGSKQPEILAIKQELDRGVISPSFETLCEELKAALQAALADCDVCIVHNAHTMNKNLVLTAALARLSDLHMIAWCHDFAWTMPQYQPELHVGYPWNLLRERWANTRYVTVSAPRRDELAALLGMAVTEIKVIGSGMDLARFLRWTRTTERLVQELHLLEADGLLLLPARLTRRKNIALALEVLAELRKQSQKDYRLIVTGPPGPHNPSNPGYLGTLLALRRELKLEGAVHFLYELDNLSFIPDDDTMADLYQLCDALFFPSIQEGFGIPMLEAGLSRLPIYCSDIPALRETGQEDAVYFNPLEDSPQVIARRIHDGFATDAQHRLRLRVRKSYRWDTIIQQQLVPLLEEER